MTFRLGAEEKLERLRGEVFAIKALTELSLVFNAIGSDRVDIAWIKGEIEEMERHGPEAANRLDTPLAELDPLSVGGGCGGASPSAGQDGSGSWNDQFMV